MIVFEILGVWVTIVLIITVLTLVIVLVDSKNHKIENASAIDFLFGLIMVVLFAAYIVSSIYVNFKTNPEKFGYTAIESEITENSEVTEND